jgi:hypothetical protein
LNSNDSSLESIPLPKMAPSKTQQLRPAISMFCIFPTSSVTATLVGSNLSDEELATELDFRNLAVLGT